MAKRKKESGYGLIALAILLFIFIILVILLTPIILFISWLINFVNYYKNYKRKIKNKFWLNDSQKEHFKILAKNLNVSISQIKKAESDGNNEGLSKNQDGSFSARSNRGKEIRGIIDKYQGIINEQKPKFDYLQELPLNSWTKYRKTYSKMIGFGMSLIAWAIATYIYISKNFDDLMVGLKDYFRFPVKIFESLTTENGVLFDDVPIELWKNLLMIVAVSICAYFIGWLIGRIFANIKCRKPDYVNIDNVDKL